MRRRAPQQPHRKLSRIAVSSETTPIWQQQTLHPTPTLQQRFDQNPAPVEYIKPSISFIDRVPSQASIPTRDEPATLQPETETEDSFVLDSVAIPPTPSPEEDQETDIVPQEDSSADVPQPQPSLTTEIELAEPSYISSEIEEKVLQEVAHETPLAKPKTNTQLNATLQQLEETLTNIDNTIMSDLSTSLEQITGIRNKIQEQEQKLKQLHAEDTAEDHEADVKAKKALLSNLKHALDNTQIELAELEKEPSADVALISQLREQLALQKRSFDQLQREHKEILEKQTAVPNTNTQTQTVQASPTPQQGQTTNTAPKITTVPNAINGVVTDTAGKLITEAVVIIKSDENRPLRALKTNQLGQFWVTTALENGSYLVETEASGLNFDTVAIELNGDIVQPINITAK